MRWQNLWAVGLIMVLVGCAQTEEVKVSSLAADVLATDYKRFAIVSEDYQVVSDDLAFMEYARQTAQMLTQQGYQQVFDPKLAQILVALSYQIGPPKTRTEVVKTPVYPMVGGGIYTRHFGFYYPYWYYPQYETSVYQFTTYQKTVRLQAIDAQVFRRKKAIKPLWDVAMLSNNDNGDLRYMFPYMIVAASNYIAKNSGQSVAVSLDQQDPRVARLRAVR